MTIGIRRIPSIFASVDRYDRFKYEHGGVLIDQQTFPRVSVPNLMDSIVFTLLSVPCSRNKNELRRVHTELNRKQLAPTSLGIPNIDPRLFPKAVSKKSPRNSRAPVLSGNPLFRRPPPKNSARRSPGLNDSSPGVPLAAYRSCSPSTTMLTNRPDNHIIKNDGYARCHFEPINPSRG